VITAKVWIEAVDMLSDSPVASGQAGLCKTLESQKVMTETA
jgi:hypothetical protein